MSLNQSISINNKIIKPIELVLNSGTEKDINDVFKDPLEIFEAKTDENEQKSYTTRKFRPDDGLIYYLNKKPGKVEYYDIQNKVIRKLRMLICVTMYNEDRDLLTKTLEGIYDNLDSFCNHGMCAEDIAVVILSDGILKMDESVVNFLRELDKQMGYPSLTVDTKLADIKRGCDAYIEEAKGDLEKTKRQGEVKDGNHLPKNVPKKTALCYQIRFSAKDFAETHMISNKYFEEKLNIFFAIKILNKGKLSSHLWFFQGFCKTFNPDYCTVIDCGTKPERTGVFNFFRALEADKSVGGVCGYMGVRIDTSFQKIKQHPFKFKTDPDSLFIFRFMPCILNFIFSILNIIMAVIENIFSIQKAQEFEYAFAHIFDKAFESFFGFISVLPGAWSAYRWDALCEDNLLEKEYFKTVMDPEYTFKSIREANKILAEDRLLCLAIFTKRNRAYNLKYCPDAGAKTDLVDTVPKLLMQRKRWINGTWYALEHVIHYQNQIRFSKHSNYMKLMFTFSMIMARIGMFVIYLMMSTYYITLKVLMFAYFDNISIVDNKTTSLAGFFLYFYIVMMMSLLFMSLQFKATDRDLEFFFRLISHLLGIFMLFSFGVMMVLLFGEIFQDPVGYFTNQSLMRVLVIVNAGFYLLIVLVNPQTIKTIAFGVPHYLYYMPTYLHIMVVYAFCRIDDLSWGTKGAHSSDPTAKSKEYKDFKVEFVSTWLISNAIISYIVIVITSDPSNQDVFLTVLIFFITLLVSIKAFFAFLYAIKFYVFDQKKYFFHLKDLRSSYEAQTLTIKNYYDQIKLTGNIPADDKEDSVIEGIGKLPTGYKPETTQELLDSRDVGQHLPKKQSPEKKKNQFMVFGNYEESIWT